nr:ankyrin-1-like [Lytechinus pictus]
MVQMWKREAFVVKSRYLDVPKGISELSKSIDSLGSNMVKEDTEDYSPLLMAVRNDHLDEIQNLVSQGADVNQVNAEGWTPLVIAARTGSVEVLMFLIDKGADIRKYVKGMTALHITAFFGHLDAVKYLIRQGAEVNRKSDIGATAIHMAAVVEYLIDECADVKKGSNNGWTALHTAAENGHLNVVKYLILQGADVKKGNSNGWTALHTAAHKGHLDVIKYLISQGAEVKKGDSNGWTALHIAAHKGHLDVIKYLISQGAEVNKGNNDGWTALHFAAQNGNLDVSKFLISQGAEVKKGNHDGAKMKEGNTNGDTALHVAACNGHIDVTKYLISQGAEVKQRNNDGVTALHVAAKNGHLHVFKFLLNQGAEVNKGNNDGWTALHIAARNGNLDVVKYLIRQGATVDKRDNHCATAVYGASQNGHIDVIKYLISQGAAVNEGDINGWTALHIASQNGHIEVIKYLIILSGYIRAENEVGDIHLAIQHGQTTAIELLVSHGADLNVQSADGQMCLHEAIKLCYKTGRNVEETDTLRKISDEFYGGNLSPEKALVFYLLDNGAKTDVADKSGKLPIHYAKDEVIKQMILSRIKSPEEAHCHKDRPKESKVSTETISEDFPTHQDDPNPAVKREQREQNETQTKTTDREADHANEEYELIPLEKYCITVRISKHEIYSAKDITVEAIEEVPPELKLKETEAIIAVGLKMSPSDAIFDSPVRVTMPHCGVFTKPEHAEVFIFYRNNGSTSFKAILSTSRSNPRCIVRDFDLDIFLDHFSEFWIGGVMGWLFPGKRLYCTPCIPVPALRNEDHMVYVHVRDASIKESEILKGYEAPISEEEVRVWRGWGGLEITFKESPTEKPKPMIKYVIRVTFLHSAFILIIGVESSEFQAPGEKCQKDFDDILTEIANRINERTEIDRLGGKLGFEPEERQRYIEANQRDGDYMGTLNMLRKWRKGTTESKEREQLGKALIDAKLTHLADNYLGGVNLT